MGCSPTTNQRGVAGIYAASKQAVSIFEKANGFNLIFRAQKCISFRPGIDANHFARTGGDFLCRGRHVSFLEAGNVSTDYAAVFPRAATAGGGQWRGGNCRRHWSLDPSFAARGRLGIGRAADRRFPGERLYAATSRPVSFCAVDFLGATAVTRRV